jgi:AcrR family transcriptional regulator
MPSSALPANGAVDGRRARGDKARAHVLAQSRLIASSEGLDGLTLGRVAAEAGIGKGNIQVLFGTREALQLATLESAVDMYREMVVEPALVQPSPLVRLLALVEGWFAFVENRSLPGGCFVNAVSSEYRARPGPIRDRINHYRAQGRTRFRSLIREAQAQGELRPDVDGSRLVFELIAYQAAANVASLMSDEEEFALARQMSRERITAVATAHGLHIAASIADEGGSSDRFI